MNGLQLRTFVGVRRWKTRRATDRLTLNPDRPLANPKNHHSLPAFLYFRLRLFTMSPSFFRPVAFSHSGLRFTSRTCICGNCISSLPVYVFNFFTTPTPVPWHSLIRDFRDSSFVALSRFRGLQRFQFFPCFFISIAEIDEKTRCPEKRGIGGSGREGVSD